VSSLMAAGFLIFYVADTRVPIRETR